jgi:lactoylglutathione lyase
MPAFAGMTMAASAPVGKIPGSAGSNERPEESPMKIVHTMIRVNNLDESLKFYCDGLGMRLLKRRDYDSGRFTNVFIGYGSEATDAVIELTYNWDTHKYDLGTGFGHIALGVPDVYKACEEFRAKGVKIVREPGPMKHGTGSNAIAFLEDPNGYKIELTTRPD